MLYMIQALSLKTLQAHNTKFSVYCLANVRVHLGGTIEGLHTPLLDPVVVQVSVGMMLVNW